ncbi:MAG: ABC transporter ATP-binding protein [Patescibacteria group bacterium]
MFSRIKNLFFVAKQLYGGYKWQIVFLVLLGFLSGFLEALGIGVLIPIFSFVVNKGEIGSDFISQFVFQAFSYVNVSLSIYSLLGLVVFLFTLKAITSFVFSYVNVRIISDYDTRMQQGIYKNALAASWEYLLKQKIGHLERMIFTHVAFVTRLFQQIANNIIGFTSFLMYLFVAISLSYNIALVTILLGFIIIFIFKPFFSKTKAFSHKRRKAEEEMAHLINENVVGIKTIKANGVEKKVIERANIILIKLRSLRIKLNLTKALGSIFIQPIGFLFISVMFVIFFKKPGFDFAVFIAVMYLIQRIFQYVEKIQGSLYIINEAAPYISSLINFEKELAEHKEQSSGEDKFSFKEELEAKNLSFRYSQDRPVLSRINFKVKKGEIIGIIGPSGAGKTTLVDILLRLFAIQEGELLIDKKPVSQISFSDWRKNVGYVSQDIFLKNDTIRENIIFYGDNITQEDIERATKSANIYNFIQTLPKKFDTLVGERGVLLSAGQRQRIVLSRALARRPKILILDEATSALDNESEKLIKESIDLLKGDVTVITIAHRLSTITSADRLIAIEDGKVVDEGTPEALLKDKSSYFYRVYDIIQ